MALNAANVDVAVTGTVSYAPEGTTAPTDADSPLNVAFVDVGYISSDGITETRDRSTSNIVAWQNSDVVRTVVTEATFSINFMMLETNDNSLELFYGSPVSGAGVVDIVPGETGGRRAVVVDYVDGDKFVRLYLPHAEVLEVEEATLSSGDAVMYGVTIRAYPDNAGYSARKFFSALES
jgi:hypothetical protein